MIYHIYITLSWIDLPSKQEPDADLLHIKRDLPSKQETDADTAGIESETSRQQRRDRQRARRKPMVQDAQADILTSSLYSGFTS